MLYGILFGILFPVISTLISSYLIHGNIYIASILNIQLSNPLLWVIDSAPVFLGLFARIAGLKQDKLNITIEELKNMNITIVEERDKSRIIEEELREKDKIITEELNAAKKIQESFLPEIPENNLLELKYRYIPKKEIGGDFITITKLRENGIGIFIGDVSGHGVSAALITSLTIVSLNRICRRYGTNPKEYLDNLNLEIFDFIPEHYFLTAIYAMFHNEKNKLTFTFSRGGHPHPIIWRQGKKQAELLELEGTSIGMDELSEYNNLTTKIFSGDRLFLYTDGIIESSNNEAVELGFKGLLNIINEIKHAELTLEMSIESILKKVNNFREDNPASDDIVIIGITPK